MKALLLSAGQGRRLLPLTAESPKCALPIQGRPLVEWQIRALFACGIRDITVVTGFGADQVEHLLAEAFGEGQVKTLFNPFYALADNLATCWVARQAMSEDFLLINGDTLFEPALPQRLLSAPEHPVAVAMDRKSGYDADDMKLVVEGERLLRIGKDIRAEEAHGESIGMLLFRGRGPALFRQGLERAMRQPEGLQRWYLSVVNELARAGVVATRSVEGMGWGEIDCRADWEHAQTMVAAWQASWRRATGGASA